MKTRMILTLALALAMGLSSVALAASVEPVLVNPWQSGNAAFECSQVGDYMYAYKIDAWGDGGFYMDGIYVAKFYDEWGVLEHVNSITISNDNDITFDWIATNSIGAVIVKGGPVANVFFYAPPAYSDTELYAPINPKNLNPYGISHVTFCWNPDPEEVCYDYETAWADGTRYIDSGNWATFTPYTTEQVIFYAGQTYEAGWVTFTDNGDDTVTISIELNPGWSFNPVEESLKIQGYDEAPSGNPSPGGFAYKYDITGSSASVTVPAANFYGVHGDVRVEVACPVILP